MIVGNGEVPDGAAAIIDAADLVIRFNDCRTFGRAGEKTDIVAVCNTGRPAVAMLGGGVWKTSPAVRRAAEIWCARAPEKFEALRPRLRLSHPDLDDLCDDYSSGFRTFATATGRASRILPASVHTAVDAELEKLEAGAYVVPSSGLLVIAAVLSEYRRPGDRIVLAGFGHVGWEGHPFAAERRYVEALIAKGHVVRLEHVVATCQSSYISRDAAGAERCSTP